MGREEGTEKLQAPPDFDGPTSHRHCTDILCSLLIVAMWIAMTGVGAYAVSNGDYRVILYPLDYDGNICGTDYGDIDMSDYPYLYYVNKFSGGVCVKECPSIDLNTTENNLLDVYTLVTYGGLFQTDDAVLPEDYVQMANYTSSEDAVTCESASDTLSAEEYCYPDGDPEKSWESLGINEGYGFAYYALDSYEVLWRCLSSSDAVDQLQNVTNQDGISALDEATDDINDFWNRLYGDLWTAKEWILGFGFCVALVIGFLYTFLLRVPFILGIMVWGSIFITIGMFFAAGAYAYSNANEWDDEDPQIQSDRTITAARVSAVVLWVIGAILILLLCFLRKQIQLALGCVKETSKAVSAMPGIILFPVIQAAGFIGFMVIWMVYAAYLASLGELQVKEFDIDEETGIDAVDSLTPTISYRTFEYDDMIERSAWYLLFCFFWTSQFILACGEIIIAMSVAKWYFTRDKSTIGSGTVWKSIVDSLWYHMGTAAYGSLIIAIIKMIRSFIAYLQKKAKDADSKIMEAVLCCCQCCMWCFEKCMKFLNKNAYIQTAIFGTSFCTSAKEAFFLILRNAARIGAVEYVSEAVVIVGKLFVTSVTAGLAYFIMDSQIRDEVYSLVGPVILIGFISWFVGGMFLGVFDMGIATILQCFVADEEMFDGAECYAEGPLQEWIDKYEER